MRFRVELVKLLAGMAIASLLLGTIELLATAASAQTGQKGITAEKSQIAQTDSDSEFAAYADSDYDYWDAKVLAEFWSLPIEEAKTLIGRKVLWGAENVAYLEQILLDARIDLLDTADPFTYYLDGYTYDDAEVLADFWGDATVWDAKLRIGRNLIMGNAEIVERALGMAR